MTASTLTKHSISTFCTAWYLVQQCMHTYIHEHSVKLVTHCCPLLNLIPPVVIYLQWVCHHRYQNIETIQVYRCSYKFLQWKWRSGSINFGKCEKTNENFLLYFYLYRLWPSFGMQHLWVTHFEKFRVMPLWLFRLLNDSNI